MQAENAGTVEFDLAFAVAETVHDGIDVILVGIIPVIDVAIHNAVALNIHDRCVDGIERFVSNVVAGGVDLGSDLAAAGIDTTAFFAADAFDSGIVAAAGVRAKLKVRFEGGACIDLDGIRCIDIHCRHTGAGMTHSRIDTTVPLHCDVAGVQRIAAECDHLDFPCIVKDEFAAVIAENSSVVCADGQFGVAGDRHFAAGVINGCIRPLALFICPVCKIGVADIAWLTLRTDGQIHFALGINDGIQVDLRGIMAEEIFAHIVSPGG